LSDGAPRVASDETVELAAVSHALPTDAFLDSQFNLNNTGQTGGVAGIDINVFPVWEDYRGAGVIVGVIDDGVEHTHPDLIANYDTSLDNDSRGGDSDAMAEGSDAHGTAVAGIIAADDNDIGSVGVAPDATIAGFRMGFGANGTLGQITENLQLQVNVDISNNSWGFGGFFGDNFKSSAFAAHGQAIENAVANGRDGLGTVWLFAAGNSRTSGDDTNYHSFQNSRQTIAVAAAEDDGDITFYSTPGASIITTAPVAAGGGTGGVFSTDRQGSAGYASGDFTSGFNGTSAATPMVSGVVALILDANPELGYRDVQEILAYSSRQIDVADPGWAINDAVDWNGGGLHVSHDFGFGLVDAHAAVRLAESWQKQSVLSNEASVSAFRAPNLSILDNATVSDSIAITDQIDLQWVEVDVNIDHSWIGDLTIRLIAPDGTVSVLVDRPGRHTSGFGTSQDDINFVLTSAHHWGEDATGTWTLSITDHFQEDPGTLFTWSLTLYGDVFTEDNDFIYTDEYGTFAATDAARRSLSDTGGTDRINAAALTAAALIDLNAGAAGQLAGQAFSIAEGTLIENAIGGDGGDTLIGNAAANDLVGARGNDELTGGAGNDTLTGGAGADRFIYRAGDGDDHLTDFDALADVLVLDGVEGIFGFDDFFNAGRQTGADFLVALADGAELLFANLAGSALSAANLELLNAPVAPAGPLSFTGSSGADAVEGTEFSDTVYGNGGDDVIGGGDSADTLLGQDGHDTLQGDNGDDRLGGGAGADQVDGGEGNDLLTGDSGDDNILGSAGDDRIYGGDGHDLIWGGDGQDTVEGGVGNDSIWGGAGSETLLGQAGSDHIFGGDGIDRIDGGVGDDSAEGGIGADILLGDGGQDTLKGGIGADSIFGGLDADTLMGLQDNDYLRGDEGDDRVAGGGGDDLVIGNHGNDVLTGDDGADTVISGEGDDRAYGGNGGDSIAGDGGSDTIAGGAGADTADGGDGADSLLGDAGVDMLFGAAGADTIRGGDDADMLFGGNGNDTVLGDAGDDDILGGEGGDRLAGGEGADSILGGNGADVLTGDGGSDTLRGGSDGDLISGGTDNDTLLGDEGNDTLSGDGGNDRIAGGDGDDSALGGAGTDVITGDDGNDTIRGGDDNDVIFGGNGIDTLFGDRGNDFLEGGEADDRLLGGDGEDTLSGGSGSDLITGGAGADRFVFSSSDGAASADVIADFELGIDRLFLDGVTVASLHHVDQNGDGVNDTYLVFDDDSRVSLLSITGNEADLF